MNFLGCDLAILELIVDICAQCNRIPDVVVFTPFRILKFEIVYFSYAAAYLNLGLEHFVDPGELFTHQECFELCHLYNFEAHKTDKPFLDETPRNDFGIKFLDLDFLLCLNVSPFHEANLPINAFLR